MPRDEVEHYRRMAATERQRAIQATSAAAAEIHEKLACLYEKLVKLEVTRS